jgi:hypothetical protein
VALASYPLDSHGVTLYVDSKGVPHRERGFFVGGFKPFPISYKALRPRAAECQNLLVLSCLSASHAAYGSVRMEPVFMMLGHAAGAAASLAIDEKTTVQDIPYPKLRERLLAERQILDRAAPRPTAENKSPGAPPSPAVVSEQFKADLQVLVDKKIIDSVDYWSKTAGSDGRCDGDKVESLLIKMARTFEPVETRDAALAVLVKQKVLASPTDWSEHAQANRQCGGNNVRSIIRNYVRAAK